MPQTNELYVRPTEPGHLVRFPADPATVLPEGGATVPRSQYWLRRLADGSVVEAKPKKETSK